MGLFDKTKRGLGYNDEKLKDTGIKGRAKILTLKDTHLAIGGDDSDSGTPVYKETLLVTVPDREPYEVTYHSHFRVAVGKDYDVYVDRKDAKKVFLDTGTGLENVAQQLSTLTGRSVGNDPASVIEASRNMAGQFAAGAPGGGAPTGGTADWHRMMEQNAKMALQYVQDPAQRKMLIEQYRAAGIQIDDVEPSAGSSS